MTRPSRHDQGENVENSRSRGSVPSLVFPHGKAMHPFVTFSLQKCGCPQNQTRNDEERTLIGHLNREIADRSEDHIRKEKHSVASRRHLYFPKFIIEMEQSLGSTHKFKLFLDNPSECPVSNKKTFNGPTSQRLESCNGLEARIVKLTYLMLQPKFMRNK